MGLSDPITPQRILDAIPALYDEASPMGTVLSTHRALLDACMEVIKDHSRTIRQLQQRLDAAELRALVGEMKAAEQGQAIESIRVICLRTAYPLTDLGPFDLDAGGHQDG